MLHYKIGDFVIQNRFSLKSMNWHIVHGVVIAIKQSWFENKLAYVVEWDDNTTQSHLVDQIEMDKEKTRENKLNTILE